MCQPRECWCRSQQEAVLVHPGNEQLLKVQFTTMKSTGRLKGTSALGLPRVVLVTDRHELVISSVTLGEGGGQQHCLVAQPVCSPGGASPGKMLAAIYVSWPGGTRAQLAQAEQPLGPFPLTSRSSVLGLWVSVSDSKPLCPSAPKPHATPEASQHSKIFTLLLSPG